MLGDLDRFMESLSIETILLHGKSDDSNIYYLTKNKVTSPSFVFKKIGEKPVLLTWPEKEYTGQVKHYTDYNIMQLTKERGRVDANVECVKKVMSELGYQNISSFGTIPGRLFSRLSKLGANIDYPEINPILLARMTKDEEEIEKMTDVAKRTTKIFRKAIDYFKDTSTDTNYVYKNGQKLTVGDMKRYIKVNLITEGLECPEDIIVATGTKSSNMHYKGDNNLPLRAHTPIIIDIYPRSEESFYYADVTRTIVIGTPDKEVRKVYNDLIDTYNKSVESAKEDCQINSIFETACSALESKGYATYRKNERTLEGFIHQLGHGVGLDVHEKPSLGMFDAESLKPNTVFTVEPGLYFPNRYGIRIEDTLLLKKNHIYNLTDVEKKL